MVELRFPKRFVWGLATSAYQIEGAVDEDGRGESIWDRYCATPGRVDGGATGAVACDHYHRGAEDVALLSDLGAGAYRFSTSWARVLPGGRGPLDFIRPDDIATAAEPIDFLGVNYYHPRTVRLTPGYDVGWQVIERPDSATFTAMGWQIAPEMLTELLARLSRDHPGVPLLITENGAALEDEVSGDGRVHDPVRVDFLRRHFAAAHEAIAAGVDLRGYFVWSFMDNFEWAMGYRPRFGVVYVDYDTQRRIPKDSARLVRDVFTRNALVVEGAGGP
jgi:beta-glucosidase/6-phospho-beta-glucosidase/beta-galactosidase